MITQNCNFPEAPIIGEQIFRNHTIFLKDRVKTNVPP